MSRRLLIPLALVSLLAASLTGCDSVRLGARCRTTALAHAGNAVVACRNGRWRATGATVQQVAALLIALSKRPTPAAPTTPAAPGTPTLTVQTVLGGLTNPWEIAFAPDGTMFFTERSGQIDVMVNGARRVLAGAPGDVVAQREAGMLGLALDPSFSSNRRLYACFSTAGDVRVARFDVSADLTSLANRTDIIGGFPLSATEPGRHAGCRLKFGPDGYLWIGTGDAVTGSASGGYPQSDASYGGKVLRVTTDGAAAPGNPGGTPIYNKGHRNVQGLAFRPSDGQAYSIEHGTSVDDEVNRLVPGGNYGWWPTGTNDAGSMTDLVHVPGAVAAIWSSGSPTIAPSGATFLSGSQWGAWNGALAVSVLKGTQLRVMTLDAAGTGVTGQAVVITDQGRLRTAVEGPDGNLYLATDANPGRILRVVPG